jgi:hypothetical protein
VTLIVSSDWRRVLHREDRLGRRVRHEQQDQERDHRPHDLDHGVLVELLGLVAHRLAVLPQRIEHHAEHADEDDRTDPEDEHVQVVLLLRDRRDRRLQVVVARGVREGRQARGDGGGGGAQAPSSPGEAIHELDPCLFESCRSNARRA